MKYLKQLSIIFLITFIAEILKTIIPLPVPSSIYGMIILFSLLSFKIIKPKDIENVADFLISIMGIMFIPAGVGVVNNYEDIMLMLPAIIISVVFLTVIIMGLTAKITQMLLKNSNKGGCKNDR